MRFSRSTPTRTRTRPAFQSQLSAPSSRSSFSWLGFVAGALGTFVGALAIINAFIAARTPKLGPRLSGLFSRYPARYGDLAYVVAGQGSPVLLVHGLDAGRSMAEWRGAWDDLADHHTVYAFDFQSSGLSDSNPEGFNATDFAEQISGFVRDIIGQPTRVVAAGQGAIFAILAARVEPELIEKLVLVCPQPPALDAPSGDSRAEALLQRALAGSLLRAPVLGTALLNRWRSTEQLQQAAREHGFFDKKYVESEARLWHVTAHQSGSARGQKALLQGAFEADWRAAWREIEVPALLVWGRNAQGQGFESSSEWGALRPDARLEVVDEAMLFPHLEQSAAFCRVVLPFLKNQ